VTVNHCKFILTNSDTFAFRTCFRTLSNLLNSELITSCGGFGRANAHGLTHTNHMQTRPHTLEHTPHTKKQLKSTSNCKITQISQMVGVAVRVHCRCRCAVALALLAVLAHGYANCPSPQGRLYTDTQGNAACFQDYDSGSTSIHPCFVNSDAYNTRASAHSCTVVPVGLRRGRARGVLCQGVTPLTEHLSHRALGRALSDSQNVLLEVPFRCKALCQQDCCTSQTRPTQWSLASTEMLLIVVRAV
jgi:hypothetical protein